MLFDILDMLLYADYKSMKKRNAASWQKILAFFIAIFAMIVIGFAVAALGI